MVWFVGATSIMIREKTDVIRFGQTRRKLWSSASFHTGRGSDFLPFFGLLSYKRTHSIMHRRPSKYKFFPDAQGVEAKSSPSDYLGQLPPTVDTA